VRVPREIFAAIIEAWRDGYTEIVSRLSGWPLADVQAHFENMRTKILDPDEYAVWQVPVLSGRKPRV
jgi:hypothetical protein